MCGTSSQELNLKLNSLTSIGNDYLEKPVSTQRSKLLIEDNQTLLQKNDYLGGEELRVIENNDSIYAVNSYQQILEVEGDGDDVPMSPKHQKNLGMDKSTSTIANSFFQDET